MSIEDFDSEPFEDYSSPDLNSLMIHGFNSAVNDINESTTLDAETIQQFGEYFEKHVKGAAAVGVSALLVSLVFLSVYMNPPNVRAAEEANREIHADPGTYEQIGCNDEEVDIAIEGLDPNNPNNADIVPGNVSITWLPDQPGELQIPVMDPPLVNANGVAIYPYKNPDPGLLAAAKADPNNISIWTTIFGEWPGKLPNFYVVDCELGPHTPTPTPTRTPTGTRTPPTATVTGTPPTNTPTVTGTPPTATVTGTPPTMTPTVTGTPPTATPDGTPGTPTVTGTPPTLTPTVTGTPPTPTTKPEIFLPIVKKQYKMHLPRVAAK